MGRRAFVRRIDAASGEVHLTEDEGELEAAGLHASGVRWLVPPPPVGELALDVQIRYRHQASPSTVRPLPGAAAEVRFRRPQRAVTPGQAAVFYRGERVVGGGWIEEALEPG
jgi:tRNA-specific 2-thiouridylase